MTKSLLAGELFGAAIEPVRLGRFHVLRRLGNGAMGVVYEARDTERDSRVALKVLSRVDAGAIYNLKREFRSLAGVVHPSLVALHELCHEQGIWFFTMELVDGVGFDQWTRASAGVLREAQLRDALQQLATAVQVIHAAGKLHRDLKPANVLVTAQGRLVVLDFGLVGEFSSPDTTAAVQTGLVGTPGYLAPEQARGEPATQASDWYAVGVMLFEALTGHLPFEGNPLQVLNDKQQREACDPRELAPGLPDDLCTLCRGLLHSDPGQRAASEQIRQLADPERASAPEIASSQPRSVFVGRETELAALLAARAAVAARAPQTVLVAGRSGMGKSVLLDRFVELASADGLCLRGRCLETESVPYKVFDWVVDALSHHLRGLSKSDVQSLVPRHAQALLQVFPVLGQVALFAEAAHATRELPAEARKLRNQGFAALKELLLRLSDRVAVTIVVDDLQWGDLDSARMLADLFEPPEPPPLLFVGAYRSDEADTSDFLHAVLGESGGTGHFRPHMIELGPLLGDAGAALVRELLAVGPEVAASIAAEAEGVPFFIAELAQYLRQEGVAGERKATGPRVSLEQVILGRVTALHPDAQRLLQVLSVAAGPLEQLVASEAAALPAADRAALTTLRAARLIRTRGARLSDGVETYHDRVRETVVRNIPPDALRRLHANLARALERNGAEAPERLVAHLSGAGDDYRAGQAAVQAAHAAVRKLAFNRAAALFQKAIELLPGEERVARALDRHLGDALANSGRGSQAAEAYLRASESQPSAGARALLRMAAQQYFRSGRNEQGFGLLRSILGAAGVKVPLGFWALLGNYYWQRLLLAGRGLRLQEGAPKLSAKRAERLEALSDLFPELMAVEPMVGSLLQTRCLREALNAGDLSRALQGMVWEVGNVAFAGGPRNERKALRLMGVINALAQRVDTPYARGMALFADAARLLGTGRSFCEASVPALAAQDLFLNECTGAFWESAVTAFIHLTCLEWRQELPEQVTRTRMLLREATERDDRFGSLLMMMSVPYSSLMRDDPGSARAFLDEQLAWLGSRYTNFKYLWLLRMIETLSYAGSAQEGIELVLAQWPTFRRSPLYTAKIARETCTFFFARCALAAFAETRDTRYRRLASRLIAPFANTPTAFGAYHAALAASIHASRGRREDAIVALEVSRARFSACQTGFGIYAERLLAELRGDAAGVLAVDQRLRDQGVHNPQRWAWNHIPTLDPG